MVHPKTVISQDAINLLTVAIQLYFPGRSKGLSSLCHVFEALVSSGCYNKLPQTGRLKQQTLMSHNSEGWEVQDLGASRFSSW